MHAKCEQARQGSVEDEETLLYDISYEALTRCLTCLEIWLH